MYHIRNAIILETDFHAIRAFMNRCFRRWNNEQGSAYREKIVNNWLKVLTEYNLGATLQAEHMFACK